MLKYSNLRGHGGLIKSPRIHDWFVWEYICLEFPCSFLCLFVMWCFLLIHTKWHSFKRPSLDQRWKWMQWESSWLQRSMCGLCSVSTVRQPGRHSQRVQGGGQCSDRWRLPGQTRFLNLNLPAKTRERGTGPVCRYVYVFPPKCPWCLEVMGSLYWVSSVCRINRSRQSQQHNTNIFQNGF